MNILLTGAAGRLGRATWRSLLEAGHTVRATDLRYRSDLPGRLELADLAEARAIYGLIEGCDGVAHLGNIPGMMRGHSPQEVYRNNATANMNVFQIAADVGVNCVVFASSVQVFGAPSPSGDNRESDQLAYLPADGHMPAEPSNAYALSKLAAEDALRYFSRLNADACLMALRFPMLIQGDSDWIMWYAHRFASRGALSVSQVLSFLDIRDAADLIRMALERRPSGYRQYFPAVSHLSGIGIPETVDQCYKDVPLRCAVEDMDSLIDISEIASDLGWTPDRSVSLSRKFEEMARSGIEPPRPPRDMRFGMGMW